MTSSSCEGAEFEVQAREGISAEEIYYSVILHSIPKPVSDVTEKEDVLDFSGKHEQHFHLMH